MNVVLVGSGAREHAMVWKLRQSPRLTDLFVCPGNGGTQALARNLPIASSDLDSICRAASDHKADLVIIGPEAPLALGLADRLATNGIAAFGPSRAAARIEYSKAFAKQIMAERGIPTATAHVLTSRQEARDFIETSGERLVVKADGLAVGKGVFVCGSRGEAMEAVDILTASDSPLGKAGGTILIEERLSGREVSAHAFTDGRRVSPMPFACDYKRARDGDEGPNTGGMGAYSPALWLDEAMEGSIHQNITEAAISALVAGGAPYKGVLYPGLMITAEGPKVLEFNCRFGDPEAQVLLPRLNSDLLEICWATANDRLAEAEISWSTDACVAVVLASGGYPEEYETGYAIAGLKSVDPDVLVFHAGTTRQDGEVLTAGGRVLTVVAKAPSLSEARAAVYRNVQRLHFTRAFYRRDIAAPSENARTD
ncbi:MAG: phosphoribosylamine--glycine ligase [Chloroflexi bacterium]|nr:MAG: phosphoribosylamine--glycine ligase [Chloroflexota bacterium]